MNSIKTAYKWPHYKKEITYTNLRQHRLFNEIDLSQKCDFDSFDKMKSMVKTKSNVSRSDMIKIRSL